MTPTDLRAAFIADLTAIAGYAPWGLAFDSSGRLFWSGSGTAGHTIHRLDGSSNAPWPGCRGGSRRSRRLLPTR